MTNYVNIHHPDTFEVRPPEEPQYGPKLWINIGQVTVFFDSWAQFEKLKDECNRAWYAFQAEEEQRQINAEVDDDSASRNGDRNHEVLAAFGGGL